MRRGRLELGFKDMRWMVTGLANAQDLLGGSPHWEQEGQFPAPVAVI